LDAAAATDVRWREGRDMLAAAMRGDWERVVRDTWWPDAEMLVPEIGVRGGRDFAVRGMTKDLDDGVRQRLRNVVASRDLLIWETDLISPPDDPEHCPPGALWLYQLDEGRVRRMTLFHPTRPGQRHSSAG
ncbi:sigma-70 family RNA polymerase sigma factor, partial [Micromonospora azadirachtae]